MNDPCLFGANGQGLTATTSSNSGDTLVALEPLPVRLACRLQFRSVLGDQKLIGRDEERRTLDTLCENVRAGQSAAIVIRGEAGIGKTALLRYVAERAAPHFQVAELGGVESEMELAYAGLHQLCSRLPVSLQTLSEPQRSALSVALGLSDGSPPDRFLVGLAMLSLLAAQAERRPLICVIDDAQWLDDASCEVLGFVARRLVAESVAIVFGLREPNVRGDTRENTWFAHLAELPVKGVTAKDARTILRTVVPGRLDEGVRERLVAETGGNPLALLELPRGMSTAELAGGFGLPNAGGVAAQVEAHYLRRIRSLPPPTQRLMLLAAADAVGDARTVWRAATTLGITSDDASPAALERLLKINTTVHFHHPLVRSAVYRSAQDSDRRAVHEALAAATDPVQDPDRRAWHRAHATSGSNDDVAEDLERCAGRAHARGGFASAAALLERSASLTSDVSLRAERRLTAAQSKLRAGLFDSALGLLALADSEIPDGFVGARVEMLRGQIASASNAGGQAPLQLLNAAKRLEPVNPSLARRTYADAWGAAMFAGHLAWPGGDLVAVSRAARAAPRPDAPRDPFGHVLDGLALLVTDGRATAEPELRAALGALLASDLPAEHWLQWGARAMSAAAALWDFERWLVLSDRIAGLGRELGALSSLPSPLSALALIETWRGDFEKASLLVAEHHATTRATGTRIAPYGAMLLAAYRGDEVYANALITATIEDSMHRGEGLGLAFAQWAAAILNNGVGHYGEALSRAVSVTGQTPGLLVSTWMLPELVEAAVRSGHLETATTAFEEFQRVANTGSSDWGHGIASRSQALLADGVTAEGLYRESIEFLGRTEIRVELARAHLVFGEWLRRENRRVDARDQLRTAHDMFLAMPADGFAERARRELLATGERVRARRHASNSDLTPQELHVALLAREGRTNPEIAVELFISARTVEYHLGKVFAKLGITSRRELRKSLPERIDAEVIARR